MAAAVPRGPGLFCRIFTGVNSGRALRDDWKRRSAVERGGLEQRPCVLNHCEIPLNILIFCSLLLLYRRDSNLVKEEIKTFLNNRRISQAIVGQVTGTRLHFMKFAQSLKQYMSSWLYHIAICIMFKAVMF